ncbi:MAG: hypothetical protein LCH53_06015 [Bacteroidetes bacterium]|nr:hypothetical protein [Bacteroidota bacterium]
MDAIHIPQRRDLTREGEDRRPRWQRWAEQNLQTGWRLVIRHGHGDAWWERGVQRTTVSYRRACEVERLLGTEPAPATLPDVPALPGRKPVTPPGNAHCYLPYTDAVTGVTIRTAFDPEIVAGALDLWCAGTPESGFYTRSGVAFTNVRMWARKLGRTRTVPVLTKPDAPPAKGTGLVYHDAQTGRSIGVRYPPALVGRALALFRSGHTRVAAAEACGVPATALTNWCNRLGIHRRRCRTPQPLLP